MSSAAAPAGPAAGHGASVTTARREWRVITQHAGTVLVGQLAVMAFGVTDTIVAGRYAEGALAALSVGSAIFISVYVSLMGVLQALLPVWAELHGAQRPLEVGRSVRQSLYLCAFTTVLGMVVLLHPEALMRWTGVPETMQAEVGRYLNVLAYGLGPALLFRLFSTLNQGLGKPQLVAWLQLGSLLVKLPLSIWFCFGGGGLPALGLVGCAWASLVVNWLLLACAMLLLRQAPFYRSYRLWQRIEAPDWRQLGAFLRLGGPGGLAVLVEVTSFTLMSLFIARLGTAASAAHQIASSMTGVAYMMPLSLAIATSARVSYWLGARQPELARQACRKGFSLALGMALVYALALVLLRRPLASVYSPNPEVVQLAALLLSATAAYHVADALQTMCVFVLRCFRVTLMPLLIYAGMLWGVGLGGSYLLAYRGIGPWPAMQSPLAFWVVSGAALAVTALLFVALLVRTMRRAALPALQR